MAFDPDRRVHILIARRLLSSVCSQLYFVYTRGVLVADTFSHVHRGSLGVVSAALGRPRAPTRTAARRSSTTYVFTHTDHAHIYPYRHPSYRPLYPHRMHVTKYWLYNYSTTTSTTVPQWPLVSVFVVQLHLDNIFVAVCECDESTRVN